MNARISQEQLQQFEDQGYLVVENLVATSLLDDILQDMSLRLEELENSLGLTGDSHASFDQRFLAVQKSSKNGYAQFFNISLSLKDVQNDTPIFLPDSIFRLMGGSSLLDAMKSWLGPEIALNPVVFSRIKPPIHLLDADQKANGMLAQTPWHQDTAVLSPDAYQTQFVTVWIPLRDANPQDGCLKVIPAVHKRGLHRHQDAEMDGLKISGINEEAAVGVPVKRGGALIIHPLCPHAALPNVGKRLRINLDLRYQEAGKPNGRDYFPSFLLRSQKETAVTDPAVWRNAWLQTRKHLAGKRNHVVPYPWWQSDSSQQPHTI